MYHLNLLLFQQILQQSRQLSIGEWLGIITLGLNVLALVWGAATLSNKLDTVIKAFEGHIQEFKVVVATVNEHEVDLGILYDGKNDRRTGHDRRKM